MKTLILVFRKLFLAVVFIFMTTCSANAATKTWLPTTGGVWTNAANWSGGVAPVANDDIIINSNQSSNITGYFGQTAPSRSLYTAPSY